MRAVRAVENADTGNAGNNQLPRPATSPAAEHSRRIVELLFGPPAARAFSVRYWDGVVERGNDARGFTLVVNRPGALRRMLLPPSELAIVEAYLSRDVDVEGDLSQTITVGDEINRRLRSPKAMVALARHLLALPAGETEADRVRAARAAHVVDRAGQRHAPERDRAAITYHYDVGNDFYQLWLDRRMVYSCAYFESPEASLDDAQAAKLDLVCRKLRLKPGDRFLDVGCGWGALIIHAAKHYGVRATGITLSEAQRALAVQRIAGEGLTNSCTVEIRDYRDLPRDGAFDKVASIGMVEHVGVDHLPGYFAAVHAALAPGGVFLNHGIVNVARARPLTIVDRLERRFWKRDAFIDQYVFPDGKLGPFHAVVAAAEGAGFETRDVESLREHYAITLRRWLDGLLRNEVVATAMVGDRTFRVWRLYMTAAMQGFATARLNVVQTLFSKPRNGDAGLPLTRHDFCP